MNRSIQLGSAFGVRLRMQPLLLWLLGALVSWRLVTTGPAGALDLVFYLGLLMGLVVVHELAHALVARRFGVRVLDITLWPLGGMARLAEMPEDPRAETWIAAAGPLVNIAMALAVLPLLLLAGAVPRPDEPLGGLALVGWTFVVANALLGFLNLLPAMPMDGGRILRAQLARRTSWLEATERAVRVSRVFAVAMLVLGIAWNFVFLLLAAFVWWASRAELAQVRARHDPGRASLFDLFDYVLRPRARAAGANGHGEPRAAPPPSSSRPPAPEPATAAATPRPARATSFELEPLGQGGFSDADVERLERWHGRLPRNDAS